MAFYKTDNLPRDPSAIDQDYTRGDSIVSAVIVLLIIAAAFGLYFMYAGSGPSQPTIAPPVTENALHCAGTRSSAPDANSDTIG